MKKNQLLQAATSDGLYLHGYYVPSDNKKIAVLHIHGFEGNFYENKFVHALINELEEKGIGFLTVNTRGNGRNTDFNTVDGKIVRVGAQYELLEEANLDITAWLKYLLNEGYEEIVLMGHSLGTIKVVRYLYEGELKDKVNKLILLAPFDRKGFFVSQNKDLDEMLKIAQTKINEGKEEEIVPPEFGEGPTSFKTFVSWYRQDEYGRMFEFLSPDYDFPKLRGINVPTKIIVGSKDDFFYPTDPSHKEEAMAILLKNIRNSVGKIIEGAPHSYTPYEGNLAKEVCDFVIDNK